jgi:hypothetical protein
MVSTKISVFAIFFSATTLASVKPPLTDAYQALFSYGM